MEVTVVSGQFFCQNFLFSDQLIMVKFAHKIAATLGNNQLTKQVTPIKYRADPDRA